MKWGVRFAAAAWVLAISGMTYAVPIELVCRGSASIGATVGTFSFVLRLDQATGGVSVWTPEGDSQGVLKVDPKNYLGHVFAPNGNTYSVTLDRFSGEIFILRVAPPAIDSKASFWGQCAPERRMF